MPLPEQGVENHRRAVLADIVKNRSDALAGELKDGGASEEDIKSVQAAEAPPEDDPKRPKDIPIEEWAGMSDEDKANAIKAAPEAGETDEQREAREKQEAEAKAEEERKAAEVAAAGKPKVRIKVDGQEQEVDQDAVLQAGIKALQKETAADRRLEEAARLKKEAEEALAASRRPAETTNNNPAPSNADAAGLQLTDQDFLDAVKKVQYGSEAEGAAALKALVSKAAKSGQSEELTMAQVSEMLDFREAMQWANDEYKDILGDPKLKALFSNEEKRIRAAGDNRPYREVYKEIGDGLRDWRKGLSPSSAPAPKNSKETRQERKSTIVTIPQASSRQPAPTQPKEPTQSEIIENIRKARHQA